MHENYPFAHTFLACGGVRNQKSPDSGVLHAKEQLRKEKTILTIVEM
jgi:hypothetical protein